MEFQQIADCLKVLGEPTRLKILALLRTRDLCVCEFVPLFGISQPAISQHLRRLKETGFVTERRKGQWVFYSLNRDRLDAVGLALNQLPDVSSQLQRIGSVCCD